MIKLYKTFLEDLKYLSNKEYQNRAWLHPTAEFGSDYLEDYLAVFDSSAIYYRYEEHDEVFGKEIDDAFHDLEKHANDIDSETLTVEEIFYSAEMEVVRQKAANVLRMIQESDEVKRRVQFLEPGTPITD